MKSISSLHIIGSRHSGGAERFYTRLILALQDRGLNTIAVNRPRSAVSEELSGHVDQVHVSMRNVRDPFSRFRISRIVSEKNPDIVQSYMGRATRLTHLPSTSRAVHISRLGGFYKLNGYRHADAWIGNTKAICGYMTENGFPAHRVFHLPNFIDIPPKPSEERLQMIRQENGIPESAVIILGIGRLVKKKGFAILIESFSSLPAAFAGRPAYLLLVGSGPEEHALRTYAGQLESHDRIRWAGWQNDPDPYYALADLFVCPSLHEPLGNVILEAWSNKTPVISTETDGALELIHDGVNGLLVPCDDSSALAQKIEHTLKQDKSVIGDFAINGLSELTRRFGKEVVLDSYIELYEKLLATGPYSR
jgi:glycosyltransferase involved in cell wall biosynthesis